MDYNQPNYKIMIHGFISVVRPQWDPFMCIWSQRFMYFTCFIVGKMYYIYSFVFLI